MGKDRARLDRVGDDIDSASWTASFLAEEEEHDKRVLWRLGSWAVASVVAISSALLITHTSSGMRRERVAFVEMSRQAQQLQWVAKDAQDEARRLSAAVDTLNNDRDRLYARVTIVEQGLDSVTGSIAKPPSSSWPTSTARPITTTPPLVSNVTTAVANTIDTPQPSKTTEVAKEQAPKEPARQDQASKDQPKDPAAKVQSSPALQLPAISLAKADSAKTEPKIEPKTERLTAVKPAEVASPKPQTAETAPTSVAALSPDTKTTLLPASTELSVQRTDFGIDLGSANSVEGLRAIWRGSVRGWPALVGSLQPLIVVREGNDGLGLRLHLVAGPLNDAAAAARLCANLIASRHSCETSVFDGQRLALEAPTAPLPGERDKSRRKSRGRAEKPVEEPPKPAQATGFSAIFGSR